ncbi:MAG TPA: kelch repeat-containing protein [Candidatus Acidoferrum sp.]|nr:kelch repeat-containing protein [Candidatus Acidoferrum sp.]
MSITSISPIAGQVGAAVTIMGTGFGGSQGSSLVTINGTLAPVTSWSDTQVVVTVWSGTTSGPLVVTVGGVESNAISFVVQSGDFSATTGQMAFSLYGQTATELGTGQILITGGMSSSGVVNGAELYSPATRTFAQAASMNVPRWLHTTTLLNDGTVLITGGSDLANQETLDSAEIYDPVAGTFTMLAATLNTARVGHTATLLSNGQVLIVGGYDPDTGIISDAELYDPAAQVFIDLGDTNSPRFRHTATLLQNGQVLITGGEKDPIPSAAYNNAEVFDPTTWTFIPLSASLTSAREGHAATLLNNGQVLITGGNVPGTGSLNTAEIYDPSTNTFKAVPSSMVSSRIYHDSVLLNGGKVLLSGGENDSGGGTTALNSAELYDPTTLTFTAVPGMMTNAREHQTATLLNDGTVLEDGGTDGTTILNTAELYTTSQLSGLISITVSPSAPAIPIGNQQLMVATGNFSDQSKQILSSALWSSSSPTVSEVSNDGTSRGFSTSEVQGTATITASAAGVSGSTIVTVSPASLVSLSLSPPSLTMPLGTTEQLAAIGTYSDGSLQDLTSTATWSSSSSAATVSSSGLVTAASLGSSTIQASSGSISVSINAAIGPAMLVTLAVSPSTASISFGASQQFQVIGTYTDGSINNLTNAVSWFAVPSQSLSISSTGLATGIAAGTGTITASNGTLVATASITVQAQGPASLVGIVVTPDQASIPVGRNQQFNATGNYSDGSSQDLTSSVTWSSSTSGVASVNAFGLATASSQGSTTITATSGSYSASATLAVETAVPTLNTSRYEHSATLLDNGTVLIAGGVTCTSTSSCTYLSSAELYDPVSGVFAYTGSLAIARSAPAVLLGNGKVLVAGGYSCDADGNCSSLRSAEIYDPASGAFSSAGNMTVSRSDHTMTLLANGKVLIAGGKNCSSSTSCTALGTAELYDPALGTFTATGTLNAPRFDASAALLTSGQVLIAGGFDGSTYPASAELYDAVAGTFSVTGSLNTPRSNATAILLENQSGMVLIAGGTTCGSPGCPTPSVEYYEGGNFYFLGNMNAPRANHTATLLTNGQVLIAGGLDSCSSICVSDGSTEIYNPQTFSFASSEALSTGRSGLTATMLTDGSVLLIGGINNGTTVASTDSYEPSSLSPPQLGSIRITPSNSPLQAGSQLPLVATGYDIYGNSVGVLGSVVWNSSSPLVASISNAAGSAGIVNGLSAGTTTITATVGSISTTAQITVTKVLLSVTVTPSNPSVLLNSSQQLQLTATGNYSDGSSGNLTPYVTWSNSNDSVATLALDLVSSSSQIVIPVGVGTAIISASFEGVTGATTLTVSAPPTPIAPSVLDVSPSTGSAGTQVTITGSGFGGQQGSGTVWLGTTLGIVVSWNDSQVVANVSTGSSSGVAQVQQNGVASNIVPFTVITATISSISPTSGVPGTQVTISGSGFGAVQGSGNIWLGSVVAIASSWSDGQIVATVGSGAISGSAQVLQNGVWSNSVPFMINIPHITGISPNSGSAGTVVTINGSGFGALQGSGTVWIGSTFGIVTSWNDSQVTATVDSTTLSGIVKIQQNGTWSNAITFTVPSTLSTEESVTLNPNVVNMLVGNTQPIQALNAGGQSVTGLAWSSSNTNVVTLSTDDPPIVTAVGAGNATITAGNASADVTVLNASFLPIGTPVWSNPGDGSGVVSIVPAVPSATGLADVFASENDGNVLAIASDGTSVWSASVPTGSSLVPDFQGGLVIANGQSIYKLDGTTGQAYPSYTSPSGNFLPTPVTYTDGTVFTVDGDAVVAIDPQTGQPRFTVRLDDSTFTSTSLVSGEFCYSSPFPQGGGSNTSTTSSPPIVGFPIVAGDGYAYIAYVYSTTTGFSESDVPRPGSGLCSSIGSENTTEYLKILRVGTSGDSYVIPVGEWSSGSNNGFFSTSQSAPVPNAYALVESTPITDADKGILFTWEADVPAYCAFQSGGTESGCVDETITYSMARIAGSALAGESTTMIPGQTSPIQPVVQLQDGSFAGTISTDGGYSMLGFDSTGKVNWSVPNDYPQMATSDGGVVGGSGTVYDESGNAYGQSETATQGWTGIAYELGSVRKKVYIYVDLATPPYWNSLMANPSSSGTAPICHDDSDKLVLQYAQTIVLDKYLEAVGFTGSTARFTPSCVFFAVAPIVHVIGSPLFTFAQINKPSASRQPDFPDRALIKYPLVAPASVGYGLEAWVSNYGQPRIINSGYRDPLQNAAAGGVSDSRHMFGDAVDLQNETCPSSKVPCTSTAGQSEWQDMVNAANKADADFVEPLTGKCHYNCTHADWRYHDFGRYIH